MNLEKNLKPNREYRTDRMKKLLSCFQDPQNSFRAVHIAGSKGKGSTASFIASALSEMGFKTGIYASPHVLSYKERIRKPEGFFSEQAYIRAGTEISQVLCTLSHKQEKECIHPTTFELFTVMSFLIFRNEKMDFAVIETGIGGRLDATNVIHPDISVITPIELEHREMLGNTISEIAGEKAGIIKRFVPVVCAHQSIDAKAVLSQRAKTEGASFHYIDEHIPKTQWEMSDEKSVIHLFFTDNSSISFPSLLFGSYQADNAAVAYLTIKTLFSKADNASVLKGFSKAFLPGRFEILKRNPLIITDAAHTPGSIKRLIDSVCSVYSPPFIIIFGAVKGKDLHGMASVLAEYSKHIILTRPGTFKPSSFSEMEAAFSSVSEKTCTIQCPKAAVKKGIELSKPDLPIICTGSFYLVSEINAVVTELL
ncbi:MAG: bifunctional folylpolyglutamate synthase/dihydrofolate synthase [Spirochaetia bacterium]